MSKEDQLPKLLDLGMAQEWAQQKTMLKSDNEQEP